MKKDVSIVVVWLISSILLWTCIPRSAPASERGPLSLVELIKQGESELFAVPLDFNEGETKELPIGVFDSGIGGLTVLAAILRLDAFDNVTHEPGPDGRPDFVNERFVYLGDQANMPYGNYPYEQKVDFLRELIIRDVAFLLGRRYWFDTTARTPEHDKPSVKAIVIACNTATAYGLETIRAALAEWGLSLHLVGVVEAGASGAIEAMADRDERGAVAVLATVGTCKSEGYVRAIAKLAGQARVEPPTVIQQGCLGLAGAIEGDPSYISSAKAAAVVDYRGPAVGNKPAPIDLELLAQYDFGTEGLKGDLDQPATWRLNSVENYIRYHTVSLLESYRSSGGSEPISTIILGCTHFPYYTDGIAESFRRVRSFRLSNGGEPYKSLIIEQPAFIDPARFAAAQLYETLAGAELLVSRVDALAVATDEFYISVPNPSLAGVKLANGGGFTYEYKYGRDSGHCRSEYVKRVPMSRLNLSDSVRESIRTSMPGVWKRLLKFNRQSPRTRNLPESARITPTE